jgi:RimJ/RimL family protein N-acetyltransferase
MELETKRLKIREFKIEDNKRVSTLLNNLEVTRWLLVFPFPFTLSDADKTIEHMLKRAEENPRTSYNLAIELKDTKELIGNIGLVKIDLNQKTAMIMYWLGEEYWKRGYGSEALNKVLDFAFDILGLRKISAEVYPGNEGSSKLLEKFNFKEEGHLRKTAICLADNQIKDTIYYGLLKEEYISQNND